MNIYEIKRILGENSYYIKRTFHVDEMGVFGSFVRGDQKKDSDIDILVSFKKGYKDFFNYIRLKYYIEELLGRRIDLVMKDALKPRLRQKIINEALNV